jgi:hypothetical protein
LIPTPFQIVPRQKKITMVKIKRSERSLFIDAEDKSFWKRTEMKDL